MWSQSNIRCSSRVNPRLIIFCIIINVGVNCLFCADNENTYGVIRTQESSSIYRWLSNRYMFGVKKASSEDLVVNFDKKLSFVPHINNVINEASRMLRFAIRASRECTESLNRKLLYISYVRFSSNMHRLSSLCITFTIFMTLSKSNDGFRNFLRSKMLPILIISFPQSERELTSHH